MRMYYMQEARRASASISYVWKIPRFDRWATRLSRALVFFITRRWKSPNRSQIIPNDAETELRKRIEQTNETGHVKISDFQEVPGVQVKQA